MKKKNNLLTKIVAITFLFMLMLNNMPMATAAESDTINVSVTVSSVISISDDNTNLSVTMSPDTTDETQGNTLTVSSNNTAGFDVTVLLKDGAGTPVNGQLNSGSDIFDGDGTASYISVTSVAVSGISGGTSTYESSETKLGTTAINVLNAGSGVTSDGGTFDVDYDVYADSTLVPATYTGTITFAISGKT